MNTKMAVGKSDWIYYRRIKCSYVILFTRVGNSEMSSDLITPDNDIFDLNNRVDVCFTFFLDALETIFVLKMFSHDPARRKTIHKPNKSYIVAKGDSEPVEVARQEQILDPVCPRSVSVKEDRRLILVLLIPNWFLYPPDVNSKLQQTKPEGLKTHNFVEAGVAFYL
jgi:hypothetical protein